MYSEKDHTLFRAFVSHIGCVEKKFGRSIVDIRRQEDIWYEMLSDGDLIVPQDVLQNFDLPSFWNRCVVIKGGETYPSIFDVAKRVSTLIDSGSSVGIDCSGYIFDAKQWKNFLTLIDASAQGRPVGLSIKYNAAGILDFLTGLQGVALPNIEVSIIIDQDFLEMSKERKDLPLKDSALSVVKQVSAHSLSALIAKTAQITGNISFVFDEALQSSNQLPNLSDICAISPKHVGALALLNNDNVPAVMIDLVKMIKRKGVLWEIDWARLADRIHNAVRLLDDMIELNEYPDRELYDAARKGRKVFLNFGGWADCLCYLGLPYGSEPSFQMAERLARFIDEECTNASWQLAKERGVAPAYKGSMLEANNIKRRNAAIFGIAETSLKSDDMFGQGVLPLASLINEKGQMHPLLDEISKQRGFFSDEFVRSVKANNSVQGIEFVPDDVKAIFLTAQDVDNESTLKMASRFQQYAHYSCLASFSQKGELKKEALEALLWKASLLGVGIVSIAQTHSQEERDAKIDITQAAQAPACARKKKRPEVVRGATYRVETGCGVLTATINEDDAGEPCELLVSMENGTPCAKAQLEAITRLATSAFMHGISPVSVVTSLKGIQCPIVSWHKGKRLFSCADAIAHILETALSIDSLAQSRASDSIVQFN